MPENKHQRDQSRVKIIGHRGARNHWPENSLLGFRKLAKMPVDGVEFDVHLTHAGELLVIHDPTLDRTTNHQGPVAHLPLGARRDVILNASHGEAIPTLEEVLRIFANTSLEVHIELKTDVARSPYDGLEAKAIALIHQLGLAERSILTSFLPQVLAKARKIAPHIRTLSSFDSQSADRMGLAAGLETMLGVSDIIAIERGLLDSHWASIKTLVPGHQIGRAHV